MKEGKTRGRRKDERKKDRNLPISLNFIMNIKLKSDLYLKGPTDPESLDPRLISPFFDRILPCLPKNLRERLYCGVPHDRVEEFQEREEKEREKEVEVK